MANWVENQERIGYQKALDIYNKLVEYPNEFKTFTIFNFLTPEGRHLFTNPNGDSCSIGGDKLSIETMEEFKNSFDLTDTEYCITYNFDKKPSLFEKVKGTYKLN